MKTLNEKQLNDRDIKALLTPRERPVPPAGLAERIKQEIPADLPTVSDLDDAGAGWSRFSRSRVWLIAASVVVAVGGGFLAPRLMDKVLGPGDASRTAAVDEVAAEQESAGAFRSAPASGKTSSGERSAEGTEAPSEDPVVRRDVTLAPLRGDVASAPLRGDVIGDTLDDKTGADLDSTFAQRLRPLEEADAPAREKLRQIRRGELSKQVGSELSRRLDAQSSRAPRPAAEPAPAPPQAELSEGVAADGETSVSKVTTSSGANTFTGEVDTFKAGTPESIVVTSESPVVGARAKRAPSSEEELRARDYASGVAGNARVERENAQISGMRDEARQLEAELKALEEARPPAAAPPPPPISVARSRAESQRMIFSGRAVPPPEAPAASTGGTAEPNDAPYGDVFFSSAGTNPFVDTEDDALSTFGLDVDTGSYTVARRYLRDGHLPPPESVRVEEFVNYFDYGDAPPEREEFAIHAEGAPSIYGEGERYYLLRFNLSGRELNEADRRPALLTFVVDVSGSMRRENRLGLVKQALALLIDQLRADDLLALVIYGSRGQVVLEPTGDHGAIRRAIDQLRTGGSTNAEEGLTLAYELAARHRRRDAINRVILCSDGVANVGVTSAGSILDRIRRQANQGIELTTVGFGMGNYNDVLMEQLADTGNGRYAYVDTLDEARRIFVENLTGTLQTLAAEARVQVEFSPEVVSRYRLLGYENRDIADHRFRDDTVDAGEIGVGHKVTALYEIKLHRKLRDGDRIGTLRLRYGSVETGKVVELERAVTGADFARRWESASPALKLTSLVAEVAEILKHAYWAREGDLDDVFRRAQRLSVDFEGDREVADFVSLVGRAAEYRERQRR